MKKIMTILIGVACFLCIAGSAVAENYEVKLPSKFEFTENLLKKHFRPVAVNYLKQHNPTITIEKFTGERVIVCEKIYDAAGTKGNLYFYLIEATTDAYDSSDGMRGTLTWLQYGYGGKFGKSVFVVTDTGWYDLSFTKHKKAYNKFRATFLKYIKAKSHLQKASNMLFAEMGGVRGMFGM